MTSSVYAENMNLKGHPPFLHSSAPEPIFWPTFAYHIYQYSSRSIFLLFHVFSKWLCENNVEEKFSRYCHQWYLWKLLLFAFSAAKTGSNNPFSSTPVVGIFCRSAFYNSSSAEHFAERSNIFILVGKIKEDRIWKMDLCRVNAFDFNLKAFLTT